MEQLAESLCEQEESLAARVTQLQQEAAQLAEARNAVNLQRGDYQRLRDALDQDRQTLSEDRHELELQKRQLEQQVAAFAAETQALQRDVADLDQRRQVLEDTARQQQEEAASLQQRRDDLATQLEQLHLEQKQLDSVPWSTRPAASGDPLAACRNWISSRTDWNGNKRSWPIWRPRIASR